MAASSPMRTLEVTLISAKDLKDVNILTRLSVYAVAMLSAARPDALRSKQQQRQSTPADREGRRNPTWNCPLRFSVPVADQDGSTGRRGGPLALHFILRAERALGDRVVGEVHVPLAELEADCAVGAGPKFVSYQVRRPSGRGKGVLNFSYRFLDPNLPGPQTAADVPPAATLTPYPPPTSKTDVNEPVTAYPVSDPAAHGVYPPPPPHPTTGAAPYLPPQPYPGYPGYPPQHLPYGYGAPPPQPHAGYSYPPPPSFEAYAYRAAAARPPVVSKRTGRMGLGMGLLGGALGGVILGEAISDASDGGGFDF